MQYDDQQQNGDPTGQNNSFDPFRQAAGERANEQLDKMGRRVPGAKQYANQSWQAAGQNPDAYHWQAAGQNPDAYQQQAQQGLGNLGGIGDMVGDQQASAGDDPTALYDDANQAQQILGSQRANASNDPNAPYSNVGQAQRGGVDRDQDNPYGNRDDFMGGQSQQGRRAKVSNDPNAPYRGVRNFPGGDQRANASRDPNAPDGDAEDFIAGQGQGDQPGQQGQIDL